MMVLGEKLEDHQSYYNSSSGNQGITKVIRIRPLGTMNVC